jgi:hypothetical protein
MESGLVPNRPLRSFSISFGFPKGGACRRRSARPHRLPSVMALVAVLPRPLARSDSCSPGGRPGEAGRCARGEHRPSPARSSGIQHALHVVVMGLGGGVRWRSTQVPDTRLPRRCRAWREGPVLAHRAKLEGDGASLPRCPWPSRGPHAPSSAGAGLRQAAVPRSSAVTDSDQQGVARCQT